MSNYSVIDQNFDKNITTSYFLSIQLTLDGFSFCVLDPVSNEYIQFEKINASLNKSLYETLKKELANNSLLKYPYQKIFITYYTSEYTLIPSPLYQKGHEETYLDFCILNNTDNFDNCIFSNKIKMADSVCIFRMPKNIVDLIEQNFDETHYFCQATPFIESSLLNSTSDSSLYHVHIDLQLSSFDIIVTSGNNLKMHNLFKYNDQKDFLYYTLLIFEQLKLDTHSTKVFLSGKIDKSTDIYLLIKKYVKQVEIKRDTKHFKFANIFKNIPLQDQLNLFNTPLCV
ncbi:DUF3822 family protein [Labilibacter sediminis]|nr:DUF3822 family protein [Labilibacter sediminis]